MNDLFILIFCIFTIWLIKDIYLLNIHKGLKALISIVSHYIFIFFFITFIYNNIDLFILIFFILLIFDHRISIKKLFIFVCFLFFLLVWSIYINKAPHIIIFDLFWFVLILNSAVIWHGFILKWLFDFCLYIKSDYWIYTVSRISMLTSLSGITLIINIIELYLCYVINFWDLILEPKLFLLLLDNKSLKFIKSYYIVWGCGIFDNFISSFLSIFCYWFLGIFYGIIYFFIIRFFMYLDFLLGTSKITLKDRLLNMNLKKWGLLIITLILGWYFEIARLYFLWLIIFVPKILKCMKCLRKSSTRFSAGFQYTIHWHFIKEFSSIFVNQDKKLGTDWGGTSFNESYLLWGEHYHHEIFQEFSSVLFRVGYTAIEYDSKYCYNPNYIWDYFIFRPEQERRLQLLLNFCIQKSYGGRSLSIYIKDFVIKYFGVYMSVEEFLKYYNNKLDTYKPRQLKYKESLNIDLYFEEKTLYYEWNNEYSMFDYLILEEGLWAFKI